MKNSNRKYIKKQKEKDQNLVALDRTPHQVLAKLSSFGFVFAEKESIIITPIIRLLLRKKRTSMLEFRSTNVHQSATLNIYKIIQTNVTLLFYVNIIYILY